MITIQIFTDIMTKFYFSKYLFIATTIYGIMQCIKLLVVKR